MRQTGTDTDRQRQRGTQTETDYTNYDLTLTGFVLAFANVKSAGKDVGCAKIRRPNHHPGIKTREMAKETTVQTTGV